MLIALAIIPILILIHILKSKPKEVDVSNLFLWQEVLRESGLQVALKRLKKNLPLLLQILMIILMALALSRPTWRHLVHKKGDIILVIDTSASMQTKSGSGTRFDLARAKALQVINQCERNQRILVVEAGRRPILKSGFSANQNQARNIVAELNPTDAPAKLEKALYLALSFIDPSKDDHIVLISDGAGSDLSTLLKAHPKIVPIIVSGQAWNIGITKFEFRQAIDRPDAYEIMLEVKNFTPQTAACPLRLAIDKTLIFENQLKFGAREKKVLIFPYSGLISGIAQAALEIDDDFSVDNTAHLALSPSKDIWILLVSQGNYFLEKLLQAYPNVMVNSVPKVFPSSWKEQTERHDIVIIDRIDFPLTEKGNFLLIDAYSPSLPLQKTGQIDFPRIVDWNKQSPLMANVNMSAIRIEKAARLKTAPGLQPLVESSQGGLMYTFAKNGLRAVFWGFDIARSDLPLKVAFPTLMSNIINWLNPHKLSFSNLQTNAGEPFDIYLDPETKNFAIRAPNAKWKTHKATSNPFTYTDTNKVGIYTVSANKKQRYFTVNLFNAAESDINPKLQAISSPRSVTPSPSEKTPVQQHLWTFLLILGLAVLILEWHFWLKTG